MKKTLLFICMFCYLQLTVFSQQNSENGSTLPVKGVIKVLLVFAEYTNNYTQPSSVPGYGEAPLPVDANDYFDNIYTPGIEPTAYISKYFYQASFGEYVVLGDYIDHRVQTNDGSPPGLNSIYNYIRGLYNNGSFSSRLTGNSAITDFDSYRITDLPGGYEGVAKTNIANNRIDAIIIMWKNHPSYNGGGLAVQPLSTVINPPIGPINGFDNSAAFDDFGGERAKQFVIQEYFHAMFGGNHWHTGDGAGNHTFFTRTSPFGIPTQSAGRGVSNVVNAWGRYHLGYYG